MSSDLRVNDDGCVVVRPSEAARSKQGHDVLYGISAEKGGSEKMSSVMVTVAPGETGKAHRHDDHETIYLILEGRAIHWYGERLERYAIVEQGDFFYVPPGMPHLPMNASETERVLAVATRSDASKYEDVQLMPELDGLPHTRREVADGADAPAADQAVAV